MAVFDLHVHTVYSGDSVCKVEDAIAAAKQKGLDGIAITDHNTVAGQEEAYDLVKDEDFLIIPGIEISSKHGHILGLGIEEEIPLYLPAADTVSKIREHGGIAVAAHPFSLSSKPFSPLHADFDAIEVLNSRRYIGNNFAKKFASDRGIPRTGGSDAHICEEVGFAGIEVDVSLEVEEVLKEIKHGKASVFGRTLPLSKYVRRFLKLSSSYI